MSKPKLIRMVTHDHILNYLTGQLAFLKNDFEVVAVAADTGQLQSIAGREGVRAVCVDMHREISIWNDIRSLLRLIRLFRQERPQIVHAHSPKATLLGMMAAWFTRVPNRIYTVTGLRFETTTGLLRLTLKTMERISCACATKVIPEGDGVRNTLLRERITRRPTKKLHNGSINGIDLDHFRPNAEIKSKACQIRERLGGGFTFIFIGRIVKDKGINELVESFISINKAYPETRLLLLGKIEALDPISQEAMNEISGNPCIEYAGFHSDIRPFLAASDVLVLPSSREGFPNVVMQAGAMGLPCIVTDINGCNEIIVDGKNGLIIPKQDAGALTDAMTRAMHDTGSYHRMARHAREMIASRYAQAKTWQATLDMYRSCDLSD